MKYFDNNTVASDSINLSLDMNKLKFLLPEIFSPIQKINFFLRRLGFESFLGIISEHIKYGDSQGAIVVNNKPLIISTYNEDLDSVVLLRFEEKIQNKYNFNIGDKLICINTFGRAKQVQSDIIPGTKNSNLWQSVHPIIAELVSSNKELINIRKKEIGEEGYEYIANLTKKYLNEKPNTFRDGRPLYSAISII